MSNMIRNTTFFQVCAPLQKASLVIFGAPLDATTSFRPGTRFASSTIRQQSYGLELFSPYQDKTLNVDAITDLGDCELPFGNPRQALNIISKQTQYCIDNQKIPIMIGGEHLITLGAIEAFIQQYPDLHIIHFDAHADLRDTYMGEKLSHATVMHRCYDLVKDSRIFQFGIRSGEQEEFSWNPHQIHQERFSAKTLPQVLEQIQGKPLYVTIDIDVLDPSECPATGTPEAGGWSFSTLLDALLLVLSRDVVGVDLVELNPMIDQTGQSTAIAGKLLREILIALQP